MKNLPLLWCAFILHTTVNAHLCLGEYEKKHLFTVSTVLPGFILLRYMGRVLVNAGEMAALRKVNRSDD